ncbi:MAG: methylated-DNA--[protein]-cysteine S-methyltransferase [Clostridiales Family XIII bacterium]|jgi:methylated-DNA-[protein]-cysteine S-methyltransferase|nr:methylated-DNA--[protein]-cysteine S-methyltransferase [Clostridiales Family XIII bacterium]
MFTYEYDSRIGKITMASDGVSLTGLWFDGQKYFAGATEPHNEAKSPPVFENVRTWLDCYFSGEKPDFTPPISMNGSPFRMSVWKILREIPYGEMITYGDIAKEIAAQNGKEKMSARAVGGAVGHNPISIIVPCHRVIGKNGNLTGYGGGIDMKIQLLSLEGVDMTRLHAPKSAVSGSRA